MNQVQNSGEVRVSIQTEGIEVFSDRGPADEVAETVAKEFKFFVGEPGDPQSKYIVEIERYG